MAVYTPVSDAALERFLSDYAVGRPRVFKGIAEGVENSNFFLETEHGRFVLTLYEKRVQATDLPFFLGLMAHAAGKGFPCAPPIAMKSGAVLGELNGRPAALVAFMDGVSPQTPSVTQCAAGGRALARFHRASADFTLQRENDLSLLGWRELFDRHRAKTDAFGGGVGAEVATVLTGLERTWPKGAPQGVIHADLFPDNVLFLGDRVSSFIDFYFACDDALAYDLAVCLNAWGFDADHRFDPERAQAFTRGYQEIRALSALERDALPVFCQGAALRFFLTRLADWGESGPGALVREKDPAEYLIKVRFHRDAADPAVYGL
ncbi:MAG: homoserine kinase [Maricaulaceae bacterium]